MKKKSRKRILLATVLLLTTLCGSVLPVFAAMPAPDAEIEPQWIGISTINIGMTFVDGVGNVAAATTKKSNASLIEATLYLYKQLDDGYWLYLGEWSDSKAVGTLAIGVDFMARSGVTYRGIFVVTAYVDGVPETETVEYSRTCP